jgi:hypothetical protein
MESKREFDALFSSVKSRAVNIELTTFRILCLIILGGSVVSLSRADVPDPGAMDPNAPIPAEAVPSESAMPGPPAPTPTQSENGDFRLGPNPDAVATQPPLPPLPKTESWSDQIFGQRLPVSFGITVAEYYSDNIFYQPKKTEDYITAISPSLTLTLGHPISLTPILDEETAEARPDSGNLNYLRVTYHPTITLYAKDSDLNVVDEFADALYAHQFAKFSLSIEQRYEKLSQPTIEDTAVGTLVHRDIYTTSIKGSYAFSDKLSTYAAVNQTINDYQSNLYTSSNDWNAEYYFLYQLFPKLSIGVGPRIGYTEVEKSANQAYQGALVHLFYPATGKLSFILSAGGEVREFEHNEQATSVSPILEADAIYRPFDSMTVTFDAQSHRIVSNSQVGQDYTSTLVTLGVRQRFLQVMYFNFGVGYQDDAYSGSSGGGPARDDQFYFVRTGLEWTSKDWLKIDASYQYSRDDSNYSIFDFNENRFVVSATVKY